MKHGKSIANWDPGAGKGKDQGATDRLMSTTAREFPDNVTGTNELKEFVGKKGTPTGPFGMKGREF